MIHLIGAARLLCLGLQNGTMLQTVARGGSGSQGAVPSASQNDSVAGLAEVV